jgi:hypothetical protein
MYSFAEATGEAFTITQIRGEKLCSGFKSIRPINSESSVHCDPVELASGKL